MLGRIRSARRLWLGVLWALAAALVSPIATGATGPSDSDAEAGFVGGPPGDLNVPGVLHLQAQHVWYGPAGEEQRRSQSEFWFDPQTESARLEEADASGKLNVKMVRQGLTVGNFLASEQSTIVQVAADKDARYLNSVHDQVLGFRTLRDAGQVQVVAEESFAGVMTTRVRTVFDTEANRVDVDLEKESGLPVRQRVFQVDPTAASGPQLVGTELIKYTLVEHVAQSVLDADTFSTIVPAGWNYTRYTALTPGMANAFQAFDIYWLGPSFGGLQLFAMSHDEAQRGATSINSVSLTYTNAFVDGVQPPGQVSVLERPPGSVNMATTSTPSSGGATPRSLIVAGRDAKLFESTGGPARLEMTVGGTFITIQGPDASQLLQAAGSLQKLN